MNYALALLIPTIFLLSFVYAAKRKVKIFDSFVDGMKGAIPLVTSVFPYIVAVTMLNALLSATGLDVAVCKLLSPVFSFVGIPTEIAPLIFVKPLSGRGSIAVLSDILQKYGVDSYIGRCACTLYGASETIFYIGAVYFAGIKRKKLTQAIVICLCSYILSVALCCFLCRWL